MTDALAEQPGSRPIVLLRSVVDALRSGAPDELRHDYVDVFDLSRAHPVPDVLDRRRHPAPREALAAVKQLYRDSGYLTDLHGELPDHLPIVLEFCARVDHDGGRELLGRFRGALEKIERALRERRSVYADALAAIVLTLPESDTNPIAPQQTPVEFVGLEPYGPRLLPLQPTGRRTGGSR